MKIFSPIVFNSALLIFKKISFFSADSDTCAGFDVFFEDDKFADKQFNEHTTNRAVNNIFDFFHFEYLLSSYLFNFTTIKIENSMYTKIQNRKYYLGNILIYIAYSI